MFLHYRPRRSSEEVQKLTDSFLVANSESFSSNTSRPEENGWQDANATIDSKQTRETLDIAMSQG
jgi:hypothetical protein